MGRQFNHPDHNRKSGKSWDCSCSWVAVEVLIYPSLWQEAFGLVALEAQLRGIPVVSTSVCGLAESNRVPRTAFADVPLVYDQRTHELILGMTMEEAENTLQPERPGGLTIEQWRQTAINQENYQKAPGLHETMHLCTPDSLACV